MYVNAKMTTVEVIPGMRTKESGGGDELNYDNLIHCNNF
jgi:hypothetical protein